jgi:hypothetical protein
MPPHSSHLLQPLYVSCFSPLKRAYSREIEALIRHHINHITKLEFLPAFKAASARKQRKKKRIRKRGVLTKGEGEDILAQREADQQIAREMRQGGERSGLSRQALARCSRCKEPRHNTRTCGKDPIDTA